MRRDFDCVVVGSKGRWRLSVCAVVALCLAAVAPWPAPAAEPERQTLTAAEGTADAKFGTAVSVSRDTAVVGAPDEGGTAREGGMGAAYVFTRNDDGTWTEHVPLVAPVRSDGDKFGFAVAVDRDTVVVGAPNAEETFPDAGVAYVFVRSGGNWVLEATLTPSDGKPADLFGFDVAVSGDTVVIGASGDQGSAYVFTRSGDVWSEQAKLTARDGAAGDSFGYSTAISGDTVVIGAISDDVGVAGIDQGSAYVFTRTGSTWTEQAKLTADDGSALEAFGESIAIVGDTMVVGASFDDIGLNAKQGSAYVFVRVGESWAQQAKLTAPDGGANDMFGRSVAVMGGTVAVGAHFNDDDGVLNEGGGSVYVFHTAADASSVPTKLTETGAGLFGVSVAMSGDTVIAGANFTKVGTNGAQGAAYVYRFRPSTHVGGDRRQGR